VAIEIYCFPGSLTCGIYILTIDFAIGFIVSLTIVHALELNLASCVVCTAVVVVELVILYVITCTKEIAWGRDIRVNIVARRTSYSQEENVIVYVTSILVE
jgi:hypothetical protein